jgi:hypothetical protein
MILPGDRLGSDKHLCDVGVVVQYVRIPVRPMPTIMYMY